MKKIFCLLLAAVLCISLGITAFAEGKHNHGGVTFEAWTATDSLPTTSGNYYLVNDVAIEEYVWIQENVDITLCLNDKVLTAKKDETCAIWILKNASFTVYDCGSTIRSYSLPEDEYYWVLDETPDKTKTDMLTYGGVITGMFNSAIMNSGNLTVNSGNIVGNAYYGGYSGGGIKNDGTLTINGGHIVGNQSGNDYGGGIMNSGTLIMTGGEIAHNYASYEGAGICSDTNATAEISGGIIHNNKAELENKNISNEAGELTDLLAEGYTFYDKNGNQIDAANLATAEYIEIKSTHQHSWSNEWTSDATAHWHECTDENCPETDNTQKGGYETHTAPADDGDVTTPVVCETCAYVFVAAEQKPEEPKPEPKPESCDHKLDENGKCSRCGVVIVTYSEKLEAETNPGTGAPVIVPIAFAAIALAGAAITKRE